MIAGQFSDLAQQKSVLPAAVVRALEAIQKVDPQKMEPGRYEVEGDKLFYLVQDVELRTLEESRAEAHRQYADIQLPYSTSERYGFALPQPKLPIADDQLKEKDLAFFPTPAGESFIDINRREKDDPQGGHEGPQQPARTVISPFGAIISAALKAPDFGGFFVGFLLECLSASYLINAP